MIPTWLILVAWAATAALVAALVAVRARVLRRRADRECAVGIARRVRDRRYLTWLEGQFDAEGSDAP